MLKQNVCLIVFLVAQIRVILCGTLRNESLIQARIRGGVDADINSAPFQVSIRYQYNEEEKAGSGMTCGGSLISDNVVLTAAHCVFEGDGETRFGDPNDWVVIMGNLDWAERNENTLEFNVKKLVERGHSYHYPDIALVFLDGVVPKNHPTVKPVILNSGPIASGTMCHMFGWGDLAEVGVVPRKLQTLDLPYVSYTACVELYPKHLLEDMFCAGAMKTAIGGQKGDSGGPTICGGVQAGIHIKGLRAGVNGINPNININVAFYSKWIEEQVKQNGGSPPTFASA